MRRRIPVAKPEGWNKVPVWAALTRRKQTGVPDLPLLSVYRDYGVIPKNSRDDNYNREGADRGAYQVVRPGNVVANKMKTWQGSIAVSELEGLVSPAYIVCDVDTSFHPRYLHYLLRSMPYVAEYRRLSYGVRPAQWDLRWDDLRDVRLLKPPTDAQEAIAGFLDREAARIDRLVGKKKVLIELLEEKRTALISHVVTKGLDPNVPMKDSGVLWIGEIPAYWSVLRNKVPIRQMDDRSGDGSGRLLTVSHLTGVRRRDESPQVAMFMAESLVGYRRCRSGDLVINTMWAWMGGAGVAAEDGLVSPSYNVYRLDHDVIDPSFYDWFVRSPAHVSAMRLNSRGVWTSRLRLYPEVFLSMQGLFPPLEEQHRMSAYLSTATGKMDRLQAKLAEQLELLAEYRQALITAAVTGQIDVATHQPEPEETIA